MPVVRFFSPLRRRLKRHVVDKRKCLATTCREASAAMIHGSLVEKSKKKIKDVRNVCLGFNEHIVELTCIQTLPYAVCIAAEMENGSVLSQTLNQISTRRTMSIS